MPLILWTDDEREGRYVVSDRDGTVVLGPFYGLPDPPLVAQRLADSTRRRVFLQHRGGSALEARLFRPFENPSLEVAAKVT